MTEPSPDDVERRLNHLAASDDAAAIRTAVCREVAHRLGAIGRFLWVAGYVIGPDRPAGVSPFGFGDDNVVGLATIAQIGGELGEGTATLLEAGNLYSASALLRQLVEVEYLSFAFAEDHEIAAEWLRAEREERLAFWSPAKLRSRAGGEFLASDYWHHCEMGGHPTTRGRHLLPDHATVDAVFLWVEFAGHLSRIWRNVLRCAERHVGGEFPADWSVDEVGDAIEHWRATDQLHAAVRDLTVLLRREREDWGLDGMSR